MCRDMLKVRQKIQSKLVREAAGSAKKLEPEVFCLLNAHAKRICKTHELNVYQWLHSRLLM